VSDEPATDADVWLVSVGIGVPPIVDRPICTECVAIPTTTMQHRSTLEREHTASFNDRHSKGGYIGHMVTVTLSSMTKRERRRLQGPRATKTDPPAWRLVFLLVPGPGWGVLYLVVMAAVILAFAQLVNAALEIVLLSAVSSGAAVKALSSAIRQRHDRITPPDEKE
jgi:hypothetical protein